MAGIFVRYRRDDTQGWVGHLTQALQDGFPQTDVFYDIDTIQPGEDFTVAIDRAMSSCQVVLVLIGPQWLNAQTEEARPRMDDPEEFVRREIAAAPALPILVVPVLFGGAAMPPAASLPEVLRPLAHRQGHEITNKRWDYDCNQLLQVLGKALGVRPRHGSLEKGASPGQGIAVARGLTVTEKGRVRNIVGARVTGEGDAAPIGRIDVAEGAHIAGEAGDIVGIDIVKGTKKDSG